MRGELMQTCIVWAERSTRDSFWVPSHRFNSATGEQKGITQTIYIGVLLKNTVAHIVVPLCKLFRISLFEGNVPDDWKSACVVPLHKKGDVRCSGNSGTDC